VRWQAELQGTSVSGYPQDKQMNHQHEQPFGPPI
jgi:hypothetical protein